MIVESTLSTHNAPATAVESLSDSTIPLMFRASIPKHPPVNTATTNVIFLIIAILKFII